MSITILVADDEPFARQFLRMVLEPMGHRVITVENTRRAEEELHLHSVDVLFLDIKMPGEDGLSFLTRWNAQEVPYVRPSVVVMTGHGSVASAVEAMKLGASDYMEKPFESPEAVTLVVERVLGRKKLADENQRLRQQLKANQTKLLGESPAMLDLHDMLERVSPLPVTVLIRGESGTGKELVARTIHENSSRAQKPFIAINCAAVPEGLLESTLFGHEKGAFTGADKMRKGYFEEAAGGTLFLDEIGDMSLTLQARLLRVLQERSYTRVGGTREMSADVRILAATHRNLPEMIQRNTFREDLYYRLKVIELFIPPLRNRTGDIEVLSRFFLSRTAQTFGRPNMELAPQTLQSLSGYSWPGNVRELEHTIARMAALAPGNIILPDDLPPDFPHRPNSAPPPPSTRPVTDRLSQLPLEEARASFEASYLREVLRRAQGNVSRAAELAGIARQHLHRKLKRYAIESSDFKP